MYRSAITLLIFICFPGATWATENYEKVHFVLFSLNLFTIISVFTLFRFKTEREFVNKVLDSKKEETAFKKIIEEKNLDSGVKSFLELLEVKPLLAKRIVVNLIQEEMRVLSYLVHRIPVSSVIEIAEDLNLSHKKILKSILSEDSNYSKCIEDYEKQISKRVKNILISESRSKLEVEKMRAQKWASLIKRDYELGRYIFSHCDMKFVAKIFEFMSKDEISLVFDQVLQKRDDFSGIKQRVKEILDEEQEANDHQEGLEKMVDFFSVYDEKNISLGLEKVSIHLKNEIKIFNVLCKNITPTLLTKISPDLMKKILENFLSNEFFRFLLSLDSLKRSELFSLFIEKNDMLVENYQRYIVGKEESSEANQLDELRRFQQLFLMCISSQGELSQELFSQWKLPIKRLASGLSFEQSFNSDPSGIKKSA